MPGAHVTSRPLISGSFDDVRLFVRRLSSLGIVYDLGPESLVRRQQARIRIYDW